MDESRLDLEALIAALDSQRQVRRISWRQLGREAEVSPSTLTRMQQGRKPDVDTFGALVRWLGASADDFVARSTKVRRAVAADPFLVASTLLRGKKKMKPEAVKALQELVRALGKVVRTLE